MFTSLKRLVLSLVIMSTFVFATTAKASLYYSFGDGNRNYSSSVDKWIDNSGDTSPHYSLNANYGTRTGMIDYASMGHYVQVTDNTVRVYATISTIEGKSPAATLKGSMYVTSTYDDHQMNESFGTSYYTDGGGKGEAGTIMPDPQLWATGFANMDFHSDKIEDITANPYFNTYYSSYDGLNRTYFNVSWNLTFIDSMSAGVFGKGLEAAGFIPAASVPEPASLGVLVIGSLGLIARRLRR